MNELRAMLSGGTVVASWAIAVFFFRFWKRTRDNLFKWFAAAFLVMGMERVCILYLNSEEQFIAYLLRLFAFLLIIYAVLEKNRKR